MIFQSQEFPPLIIVSVDPPMMRQMCSHGTNAELDNASFLQQIDFEKHVPLWKIRFQHPEALTRLVLRLDSLCPLMFSLSHVCAKVWKFLPFHAMSSLSFPLQSAFPGVLSPLESPMRRNKLVLSKTELNQTTNRMANKPIPLAPNLEHEDGVQIQDLKTS